MYPQHFTWNSSLVLRLILQLLHIVLAPKEILVYTNQSPTEDIKSGALAVHFVTIQVETNVWCFIIQMWWWCFTQLKASVKGTHRPCRVLMLGHITTCFWFTDLPLFSVFKTILVLKCYFVTVIFLHKNCTKSCFSPSVWTWMWRYWKQSTVFLISPDLICSSFDSSGDNGQSLMNLFLSHRDRKSIQFSISQLCVITISANVLSTVCSCRPFIWQSVYIEWKL